MRSARLVVLPIVVAAFFASPAGVGAAPAAGAVCPTLSQSGLKYHWSVIGSVTCSRAKPWLLKLLTDHVSTSSMKVPIANSPKGFHCYATMVTKSRASGGVCYTGTFAFPRNGFQWFGS